MRNKIFSLLILFFSYNNVLSQVIFVNKNAVGLNNGTSWENAYTDLSNAINNTSNGEIWVAKGVYNPSTDKAGAIPTDEKLKTFRLKINIAIYGGFDGTESSLNQRNWKNNPTVLSGDIGIVGDETDNIRHVVYAEYIHLDSNTILDGLTISDGYSYDEYFGEEDGAGIFVNQTSSGSFILKNCIIENNSSFGNGGGLCVTSCSPIIENNIFRNNKAFNGGAIYLYYSNAVISKNQIIDNKVDNYENLGLGSSSLSGGGIYVSSYSSPEISNNLIKNNFAGLEGGGLAIKTNYHTVFKNNIVEENTSEKGGGIFLYNSETYFFNNLFARNYATQEGGAIYMDFSSNILDFINNTVVYNKADQKGGGLYLNRSNPNVVNSIIFSNNSTKGSQIVTNYYGDDRSPAFKFSDIEFGATGILVVGNPIVYQNNIDINPLFVDPSINDFKLMKSSALIDSGTMNSSIIASPWSGSNDEIINFPSFDLAGNSRINGFIDMGAYEYGSSLSMLDIEKEMSNIYPNPSNGIFNVNSESKYESIMIYDILGKEIKKVHPLSNAFNIDLTNNPDGLYFMTVTKENKKFVYKLILKK